MNEQRCREIDEAPSFHTGGGAILSFREQGDAERRSRPGPWAISAIRRRYQLRHMAVRLEMEERLGR